MLAGYGLLWLWLEDRGIHIVVRSSNIDYQNPVTGAIRATCELPGEAALSAFKNRLEQKGKARLALHAEIREGEKVCVAFDGVFVAIR